MDEIWKDVVGYEGRYQVSNLGKIASSRHELNQATNNRGYKTVSLYKNGKTQRKTVHRLVADAFIPNPFNFPQINHIDENKENNSVSNLEWCTPSVNNLKYHQNHPNEKKNGKRKRFHIFQLTVDGNIVKEWENFRQIFLETGMSDWSISECCRGNRKTAYGYKWQYAS